MPARLDSPEVSVVLANYIDRSAEWAQSGHFVRVIKTLTYSQDIRFETREEALKYTESLCCIVVGDHIDD